MAYYFNNRWEISQTPPGLKVPTVAAIPIAAFMGAAFVMFMPVLGFGLLFKATVWDPIRDHYSKKKIDEPQNVAP